MSLGWSVSQPTKEGLHYNKNINIVVKEEEEVKNGSNKNQSPKQTNWISIINISLNCDEASRQRAVDFL